jgi:hypothetical protein
MTSRHQKKNTIITNNIPKSKVCKPSSKKCINITAPTVKTNALNAAMMGQGLYVTT